MSDRRAPDGTVLLYMDEIAAKAGLKHKTITQYHAIARKARRHRQDDPLLLPPPLPRRVYRTYTRSDGRPVVVRTPVWREDEIDAWLARREAAA